VGVGSHTGSGREEGVGEIVTVDVKSGQLKALSKRRQGPKKTEKDCCRLTKRKRPAKLEDKGCRKRRRCCEGSSSGVGKVGNPCVKRGKHRGEVSLLQRKASARPDKESKQKHPGGRDPERATGQCGIGLKLARTEIPGLEGRVDKHS